MIIDRFEGDFAVIEASDGKFYNIHKNLLPENAKEGSVLEITVNDAKTEIKREQIKNKMNGLFGK